MLQLLSLVCHLQMQAQTLNVQQSSVQGHKVQQLGSSSLGHAAPALILCDLRLKLSLLQFAPVGNEENNALLSSVLGRWSTGSTSTFTKR